MYRCEICGVSYEKKNLAEECENQGSEPFKFNAGDSVLFGGKIIKIERATYKLGDHKKIYITDPPKPFFIHEEYLSHVS